MTTVSMEALARFAVLPGAAELIDAFSVIPPGPMRDAVVNLAQATASQYSGAPMAQPYRPFDAPATGAQPRLGRSPPTDSPQMQAVKLRIEHPDMPRGDIAKATGLTPQQVSNALYEAKKAGAPVPKKKLRTMEERAADKWVTSLGDMTGQGLAAFERAADARRITPQDYLDRRLLALKLAMEGASYDTILKATKETDSKVVSAWLSKARSAGHKVPYVAGVVAVDDAPPQAAQEAPEIVAEPVAAEPAQEASQEAQEAPQAAPVADPIPEPVEGGGKRYFQIDPTLPPHVQETIRAAVRKGAKTRGLSLEDYIALRERMVRMRMAGESPLTIQLVTGQPRQFVIDTLNIAKDRGARYPVLPNGRTQKQAAA